MAAEAGARGPRAEGAGSSQQLPGAGHGRQTRRPPASGPAHLALALSSSTVT